MVEAIFSLIGMVRATGKDSLTILSNSTPGFSARDVLAALRRAQGFEDEVECILASFPRLAGSGVPDDVEHLVLVGNVRDAKLDLGAEGVQP